MRRLFGNIISALVVVKVPVASEDLAKDGIQGFLDASTCEPSVRKHDLEISGTRPAGDQRRTDMPTTQVELDYGDESIDGVIYGRDMQEHFGVAHEAVGHKSVSGELDGEKVTVGVVVTL